MKDVMQNAINVVFIIITINLAFALFIKLRDRVIDKHKEKLEKLDIALCNIMTGYTSCGLYTAYTTLYAKQPIRVNVSSCIYNIAHTLIKLLDIIVSISIFWAFINIIIYTFIAIYYFDASDIFWDTNKICLFCGCGPWALLGLSLFTYYVTSFLLLRIIPLVFFVYLDLKMIRAIRKCDIVTRKDDINI